MTCSPTANVRTYFTHKVADRQKLEGKKKQLHCTIVQATDQGNTKIKKAQCQGSVTTIATVFQACLRVHSALVQIKTTIKIEDFSCMNTLLKRISKASDASKADALRQD